jgi:hypothetical protein
MLITLLGVGAMTVWITGSNFTANAITANFSSSSFLPLTNIEHFVFVQKAGDAEAGTTYLKSDPNVANPDDSCELCPQFVYTPGPKGEAGIAYKSTSNNGLDLVDAKRVVFFAKGETGGEKIQFVVAGKNSHTFKNLSPTNTIFKNLKFAVSTKEVSLTNDWKKYQINLAGVVSPDLTAISHPFGFIIKSGVPVASQIVFYLQGITIDANPAANALPTIQQPPVSNTTLVAKANTTSITGIGHAPSAILSQNASSVTEPITTISPHTNSSILTTNGHTTTRPTSVQTNNNTKAIFTKGRPTTTTATVPGFNTTSSYPYLHYYPYQNTYPASPASPSILQQHQQQNQSSSSTNGIPPQHVYPYQYYPPQYPYNNNKNNILIRQLPVANVGISQIVNQNTTVVLDGTKSYDAYGRTIIDYSWTQLPIGVPVILTVSNTATPTFTAPIVPTDTALAFSLRVMDNHGLISSNPAVVYVMVKHSITGGTNSGVPATGFGINQHQPPQLPQHQQQPPIIIPSQPNPFFHPQLP